MPFECQWYIFVCHSYVVLFYLYFLAWHSYVTRMYSHIICMSLICNHMSWYFIPMYSCAICVSLAYTPMPSVSRPYVLVCYSYVTRIYSHVTRVSLVYTCMWSACHSYVTCMWFYHKPNKKPLIGVIKYMKGISLKEKEVVFLPL